MPWNGFLALVLGIGPQSTWPNTLSAKVHACMTVSVSLPDKWATHAVSCDVLLGVGTKASMAPILQGVSGGVPVILVTPHCNRKGSQVHHRDVGGATTGYGFLQTRLGVR